MNHKLVYEKLIEKAVKRNSTRKDGYFEHHHIFPRALGGGDEPENLVYLTAREHYIAHLLLGHIHGGEMWAPIRFFKIGLHVKNSHYYEKAKLNQKRSAETREKMSKAKRGCTRKVKEGWINPLKGKPRAKPFSKETLEKMRKAKLGKTQSPETREKRRKYMLENPIKLPEGHIERLRQMKIGVPRTEEAKKKMSESYYKTPTVTCEHCGKSGLHPSKYKRWHGDNCKLLTNRG